MIDSITIGINKAQGMIKDERTENFDGQFELESKARMTLSEKAF